jgi:Acyl-CoA reductase (LuxC)
VNYSFTENPKKIGLVSAGNIPAVGFFDMMASILAGHQVLIKLSNTDSVLMKKLIEKLIEINQAFEKIISIVDRLNDADAFVATGSDNSARYFEYYFSKKPNIIRKNRSSVAILTGNECRTQLANLADDIFKYYGLGCRNVSKVFVPKDYDFIPFFESIEYWNTITLNHKYTNNYDYNKALLLVNGTTHLDNGFLLVTQSENLISPISVLFFEEYDSINDLELNLNLQKDKIQCIVGENLPFETIKFGQSQSPNLDDFPDGIDIMKFLNEI